MSPRPQAPLSLLTLLVALAPAAFAATAPRGITLAVDATEAPRHVLHVRETLPAAPGPFSLSYPRWIPGEHGPTGPLTDVVNLVIVANGQRLAWRRDDVDMYRVQVDVPRDARSIEVGFDFMLSTTTAGFSSASSVTEQLLLLSWNQVLLYPADQPSDGLTYRAALTLPAGWKFGTALPLASAAAGVLQFAPVSLTTLVDSPVLAGRHFRSVDLAPGSAIPYSLEMACDSDAGLAIADSDVVKLRQLVREAHALFGGLHHGQYRFLNPLSEHIAHFGLEHHESSEDRTPEREWVDADLRRNGSNLLSHEFVHSWNGKYRRPAGLATPDYQQPMKGELLWVYEGLTQYLGWVLSSRSGIRSANQGLQVLARVAADIEASRGREWRPLVDTAVEAQRLYEARDAWEHARRSVDFYDEGLLIWLDADVTIRRLTHGERSMDDFCHAFHGGTGPAEVKPYVFDDVVRALNGVAPYDWAAFLRERIEKVQAHAPLGGIEQGGWTLAWSDSLPEMIKSAEEANDVQNEYFSIGIGVDRKSGLIKDVVPGSAAAKAGIAPDMSLVAVNGRHWSSTVLRDAVRATKDGAPLELLVDNGEFFRTCRLDYRDGLRFPVLKRNASQPDVVGEILRSHAAR